MTRRTYHLLLILIAVTVLGAMVVAADAPAPTFADPAFAATYALGEALAPNFWGAQVSPALMEPYNDASRLVQYFDKGRMEKNADGSLTNGLLATELFSGKVQLGDARFESRPLAAIPIAGDPDNPGPTYAQIATVAAVVLQGTAATPNGAVTRAVGGTGQVSSTSVGGSDAQAQVGGYDPATQHNVVAGFGAYRERVGVGVIGYAITEGFWVNVKVGGVRKDVLVQGFERRVLTYTPGNGMGTQVEMGNIGQHYFKWRSAPPPTMTPTAPLVTSTLPATTAIATTASTPAGTVILPTSISGTPYPTAKAGATHKPAAVCKAGTNGTAFVCTSV